MDALDEQQLHVLQKRVDAERIKCEKAKREYEELLHVKEALTKEREDMDKFIKGNVDVASLDSETSRKYHSALVYFQEGRKYKLMLAETEQRERQSRERRDLLALTDQLNEISVRPDPSILEMWYHDLQRQPQWLGGLTVSYPSFRHRGAVDGGAEEELSFRVLHLGVSLSLRIHLCQPGGNHSVPTVKVECDTFLSGLEERVQLWLQRKDSVGCLIAAVRILNEKNWHLGQPDSSEKSSA